MDDMTESDAFDRGREDTHDEYKALARQGYSMRDIAGMADSEIACYREDIAKAEASGDTFHAAFLNGCLAACCEIAGRES